MSLATVLSTTPQFAMSQACTTTSSYPFDIKIYVFVYTYICYMYVRVHVACVSCEQNIRNKFVGELAKITWYI